MLFTKSKYTSIYFRIVEHRKSNPSTERTESHHIIPKSLGGSDDPENLVDLTLREHWVCHRLLTKMTTGDDRSRMAMALYYMANTKKYDVRSSRVYEQAREERRNFQMTNTQWRNKLSIHSKKRFSIPENNPMYGRKHTEDSKRRMSENSKGRQAWNKGKPGSTNPDAIRKALIGKRWVYTDGDRKYLDPVDAQLLVDKGWKWGIGPRKKRSKG